MVVKDTRLTLKLVNNLTKKVYIFDNLSENANATDIFYCINLQLQPDMPDGEYNYFLFDDGYELVKGLCIIGDYTPENTTYNNNTETIVYNG